LELLKRLAVAFSVSLLLAELLLSQQLVNGATLQTLHCPQCERIHCTPKKALRLQCKGGVTTGICGCCPVCSKVEGEDCGGKWDYLGKCDEGLQCLYKEPNAAKDNNQDHSGICKPDNFSEQLSSAETCKPECTWEHCSANPGEICSARSFALEKEDCQGSCQHTSCSSCFVIKQPHCKQGCHPNDFHCIRHFGRCV
uniref:Si:ch73-330k17.3 n=1 Tax=Latimeria chalumnae TaxID=7897 RepID=H3BA69_LATCH